MISTSMLHRVATVIALPTLLFAMTACGGEESIQEDKENQAAQGQTERTPGTSGEIVAIDDTTAQVRSNQSGQVAVSWTSDTSILNTVTGTIADVSVGDCVLVMLDDDVASTVRLTESTDGECSLGGGPMRQRGQAPDGAQPDGERPDGVPDGERPSDRPSDAPDGGGRGGFGNIVVGAVTKVANASLTIDAQTFGQEDGESETTSQTVLVTSDTTITMTEDVDSSAIKVGLCMTAQGDQDDAGAVAATTITLSPKTDDSCGGGFGMGGGRGNGPDRDQNESES